MDITQAQRQIAIETSLGKDVIVLRSATIHEQLSQLTTIQAQLFSLKENIKFEDLLGTKVTIRLSLESGTRYFNGYVTALAQSMNQGSYAVYEATISPWLWFLTRTADCRIFQKQSVPDIIKAVFRYLGYTDFKEKLSQTYANWDYCVQYRETDFNFVSRLMEQEGIYYYFTHENGKHDLILADNYGAHQPIPAQSKLTFYPPDATAREEYYCTYWQVSKQVLPGKYVLKDFDFKRPKADLRTNHSIIQTHSLADYEVYDYPGEYEQLDEGGNYVRVRLEELQAAYEQAYGQSNARNMLAGGLFKLQDYARPDQDREYLITSITHLLNEDVYEARSATQQPVYSNSFNVIDSKTPFRPARLTPKPHIRGPQTAIVVGTAGEEIYTDEFGRVKLQFHWDRYGKSDENSSCWVRVSQLWAGKNWGGIHIPRIGQEVIVEFLEGDPDRPIITGRVYNGEQIVPYGLPANKTQSGIKSRSSKGGTGANFNEIRMEDKKGQEQLYIHAERNHTNITENDRSEDVGHDRSLHVGHNKSEKIDNDKKIDVLGTHTENITKDTSIKILEGNYLHDVVKGTETRHVEQLVKEDFDNSQTTTIAQNLTVTIKNGNHKLDVQTGSEEHIVNGKVTETFKNEQSTTVNSNINITSSTAKITITAATEIELHVGASLLLMKADGTIKLAGKNISILGTQKVEVGVGTQNTTFDNTKIASSAAEITSAAVGTHNITGALVKIN
ncbi:type VI secretion system Vgr family protein [Thiolinea disciformis]|uniref:type VI secretion system Vgr family protein n=1 Tax=Thiolinea disciformis TaxID=125614 RepID=UPI0003704182|nr:type VI secretion system tip protein VgrG [Thiolinea disciformis]